jgi:N-methylhydantoinase A/oxoprolinase/acetone carboxylase beta subunit
MDMMHDYRVATNLLLQARSDTVRKFNKAVEEMRDRAYSELEGDGYKRGDITLMLEVTASSKQSQSPIIMLCPSVTLNSVKDVQGLLDQYYSKTGKKAAPKDLLIQQLRLKASSPLVHPKLPRHKLAEASPKAALKSNKKVFWEGKSMEIPVYDEKLLRPNNVVEGLAIVESEVTTVLVPPQSKYQVDSYLNAVMQ